MKNSKGEHVSKNENLHKAKNAKNDEFYTRLEDIEAELWHYEKHFANKTIFSLIGVLKLNSTSLSSLYQYSNVQPSFVILPIFATKSPFTNSSFFTKFPSTSSLNSTTTLSVQAE